MGAHCALTSNLKLYSLRAPIGCRRMVSTPLICFCSTSTAPSNGITVALFMSCRKVFPQSVQKTDNNGSQQYCSSSPLNLHYLHNQLFNCNTENSACFLLHTHVVTEKMLRSTLFSACRKAECASQCSVCLSSFFHGLAMLDNIVAVMPVFRRSVITHMHASAVYIYAPVSCLQLQVCLDRA